MSFPGLLVLPILYGVQFDCRLFVLNKTHPTHNQWSDCLPRLLQFSVPDLTEFVFPIIRLGQPATVSKDKRINTKINKTDMAVFGAFIIFTPFGH